MTKYPVVLITIYMCLTNKRYIKICYSYFICKNFKKIIIFLLSAFFILKFLYKICITNI